ncbi:MAG: Maf family nucleotide pyrophosphatase [Burkholderia sp.]
MTTFSRPPRLILASSSSYRRELLERLRLAFEVVPPDLDETPLAGESPADTALRLAAAKARAVATQIEVPEGTVVIGSDQVATFEDRQIGKPGNHQGALKQLQAMRGREVEFHSALCVYESRHDRAHIEGVVTRVRFRSLSDTDLEAYLRAETPYDVAGSAKSEGLGIALLEAIDSNDPTALVGLPLIALTRMLAEAGISPFAMEAHA